MTCRPTFAGFENERDAFPTCVLHISHARAESGTFGVWRDVVFILVPGMFPVCGFGELSDHGMLKVERWD